VALGCLGNVLWFLFGGFWLALGHLITGILLCLTIIGIPFGIASFKMAGLALAPFERRSFPGISSCQACRSSSATSPAEPAPGGRSAQRVDHPPIMARC
jgi:uncharacterized membrane protein YccF (DUF307 family)